jgi:hypothetical protein
MYPHKEKDKKKVKEKTKKLAEETYQEIDQGEEDLYYNNRSFITKFSPPFRTPPPEPYIRSQYLAECAHKAKSGKKEPLRFFVYSREVIYRKKYFPHVAINPNENYHNLPVMPSDNYINAHGKVKTYGAVSTIDKDVIMLRGRTLDGGHPVFAFIDYNHDDISPCFYLEAREGFDNASYKELPGVAEHARKNKLAIDQKFGGSLGAPGSSVADKFVRWIQNYMYYALTAKVPNSKADVPKNHLVDPNVIVSYTYLYNHPGARTIYGYTPDPECGGPNRYIIKVYNFVVQNSMVVLTLYKDQCSDKNRLYKFCKVL